MTFIIIIEKLIEKLVVRVSANISESFILFALIRLLATFLSYGSAYEKRDTLDSLVRPIDLYLAL